MAMIPLASRTEPGCPSTLDEGVVTLYICKGSQVWDFSLQLPGTCPSLGQASAPPGNKVTPKLNQTLLLPPATWGEVLAGHIPSEQQDDPRDPRPTAGVTQ